MPEYEDKKLAKVNMKTGSGGESVVVNIPGGAASKDSSTMASNIFNAAFFLISAVAVISIILAGYKYMTSNGDAAKAKSAMSTIIYSVAGLVVAVSAYTIINWVLGNL